MKPIKNTATKFPRLIWEDKNNADIENKKLREKTELLKKILVEVSSFLGRELTLNEKNKVLRNRMSAVMQLLKNDIGFPNAEDKAIMTLAGKDTSPLIGIFNKLFFDPIIIEKYNITDSDIRLSEAAIDQIKEANRYYIHNETAQIAHDEITNICKAINRLLDQGIISQYAVPKVRESLKEFILFCRTPNGNEGVEPDPRKIDSL